MISAVIIDDEKDAIDFIQSIIEKFCVGINVVGYANSATEGYKVINDTNPDLVFLDVEMPNSSGFDLLEKFNKIEFTVIFVTAYDHYAIKAIKYSAADYILKPIDIDDFIAAINKIKNEIENKVKNIDYSVLFENLITTIPTKIALPTNKGIEYIQTNEIIRIEADRSYSVIHLTIGKRIIVSRNLGEFQELLLDRNFFRTHNSHLINLEHVKLYAKQDGGYIRMLDDSLVSISRGKKDIFLDKMKKFSINLKK